MSKNISVLVIEDSRDDMELLVREFEKNGFEMISERVETAFQMQAALQKRPWDIVVCDHNLPEFDAPSALKILQGLHIDIPFIVVSGVVEEETAIALMKAGAHDYVMKNNLARLIPAIERELDEAQVRRKKLQAEEGLKLSEERLRLTLEAVDDGVWDWDIPTGNVVFSSRCHVMLGYEREEFPQTWPAWHKMVHADDVLKMDEALQGHLTGNKKYAVEVRVVTKADGWRWIMTRGRVVERNDAGQPVRMVGTHSDITERKEAEERLLESEERYRAAVDYSGDGIGLAKEGKHIYVNKRFLEMFGYDDPEEIIGKPISAIVHPDYREQRIDYHRRRDEGKEVPEKLEFKGIRKNGAEIFVEATVTDTVYRGDRVKLIFSRDVTERRIMEGRRQITNEILEKLNDPNGTVSQIRQVLLLMKGFLKIDAVGIRIKKGEDYPYREAEGFPGEFLRSERCLYTRDEHGKIIRDSVHCGEVCLDCMCGRVIRGRTDPPQLFTPGGSFWTNSIPEFLASMPEGAGYQPMCDVCAAAGFKSLALLPLKTGDNAVGLLQLADRQPHRFGSSTVEFLENIASSLTIALLREQAGEELTETAEKLRRSLDGTLQAISRAVELKDPYTAGHQKRVSVLAQTIARELGLPGETIDIIQMAATIHDIGKISVPAEILSKPTGLSEIEMNLIKVHPRTGYDILKETELPSVIGEIIIQHHERTNGSGYPNALNNGQILLEAQILAIADVVEAMAFYRPYRPALGIDMALKEIEKRKGSLYNITAADACLRLFREKGFNLK